jgi:D-alanyl-D-alanine carboxypeptidase
MTSPRRQTAVRAAVATIAVLCLASCSESSEPGQSAPVSGYGLGLLVGGDACDPAAGARIYGQRGNGFGYRSLAFSSPDGQRQVTLAWTASSVDPRSDPLEKPAQVALIAGLAATCGP